MDNAIIQVESGALKFYVSKLRLDSTKRRFKVLELTLDRGEAMLFELDEAFKLGTKLWHNLPLVSVLEI